MHLDPSWAQFILSVLCLIVSLAVKKEIAELKASLAERHAEQLERCQRQFVTRDLFDARRNQATGD